MSTQRPINANQGVAVAVAPNDQVLLKVMSAPVIYVRQDPKCSLCPDTYKVYIHTAVIGDDFQRCIKRSFIQCSR